MNPPRFVQRRDAFSQLLQGGPQPIEPDRALGDEDLPVRSSILDRERFRRDRLRGRRLPGPGGRRTDEAQEIDAVDEVHREEPIASARHELVERHEVGMSDVGQRAEFALEAVERGRVGVSHHLQSNDPLASPVVGAVHDPHAPPAKLLEDLESSLPDRAMVEILRQASSEHGLACRAFRRRRLRECGQRGTHRLGPLDPSMDFVLPGQHRLELRERSCVLFQTGPVPQALANQELGPDQVEGQRRVRADLREPFQVG